MQAHFKGQLGSATRGKLEVEVKAYGILNCAKKACNADVFGSYERSCHLKAMKFVLGSKFEYNMRC